MATHSEIDRQVAEFKRAGGKVEKIKRGVSVLECSLKPGAVSARSTAKVKRRAKK